MRTERLKKVSVLLLAVALFVSASIIGYSQSYPTSITHIHPYSICFDHGPANPPALGSISVIGGGKADGIGWRAVRPNGQTITSGATPNTGLATHHLSAPIGLGTLFRLETHGLGFPFQGQWASTSFFVRGTPSTATSCRYFGCWIPTSSQLAALPRTWTAYDGTSNNLGLLSGNLIVPARSTITVKYADGTSIANRLVYMIDNNHNLFPHAIFATNGAGQVNYHIPNQFNNQNIRGHFAVEDRGFLHLAPLDQDCSGGVTRTITVPLGSTVTVSRITLPVSNRSVYVANANLTSILNAYDIKTNANGQATFSIALPAGTQFRFLIQDPFHSDLFYHSNVLTASANGTNGSIIVVAQNMPLLLSPANASSFDVFTPINFSWGYGMGAKYAWFCRHSSDTNFTGYWANGTSIEAGFSAPGTWYWFVQGYDASNNLLTQSAVRSFTITDDEEEDQSMGRGTSMVAENFSVNDVRSSMIVFGDLTEIIDNHEATMVVSEELAAQIATIEAENEKDEDEFDWYEFDMLDRL